MGVYFQWWSTEGRDTPHVREAQPPTHGRSRFRCADHHLSRPPFGAGTGTLPPWGRRSMRKNWNESGQWFADEHEEGGNAFGGG